MDGHSWFFPGYGQKQQMARLFRAWTDCFTLLKLRGSGGLRSRSASCCTLHKTTPITVGDLPNPLSAQFFDWSKRRRVSSTKFLNIYIQVPHDVSQISRRKISFISSANLNAQKTFRCTHGTNEENITNFCSHFYACWCHSKYRFKDMCTYSEEQHMLPCTVKSLI